MAESDFDVSSNFTIGILAPIIVPMLALMFLSELFKGREKQEPENVSFLSKAVDVTQGLLGVGTAALATTCLFSTPVMVACGAFLGVSTGMTVPAIIGIGIAAYAGLSLVSSLIQQGNSPIERS